MAFISCSDLLCLAKCCWDDCLREPVMHIKNLKPNLEALNERLETLEQRRGSLKKTAETKVLLSRVEEAEINGVILISQGTQGTKRLCLGCFGSKSGKSTLKFAEEVDAKLKKVNDLITEVQNEVNSKNVVQPSGPVLTLNVGTMNIGGDESHRLKPENGYELDLLDGFYKLLEVGSISGNLFHVFDKLSELHNDEHLKLDEDEPLKDKSLNLIKDEGLLDKLLKKEISSLCMLVFVILNLIIIQECGIYGRYLAIGWVILSCMLVKPKLEAFRNSAEARGSILPIDREVTTKSAAMIKKSVQRPAANTVPGASSTDKLAQPNAAGHEVANFQTEEPIPESGNNEQIGTEERQEQTEQVESAPSNKEETFVDSSSRDHSMTLVPITKAPRDLSGRVMLAFKKFGSIRSLGHQRVRASQYSSLRIAKIEDDNELYGQEIVLEDDPVNAVEEPDTTW